MVRTGGSDGAKVLGNGGQHAADSSKKKYKTSILHWQVKMLVLSRSIGQSVIIGSSVADYLVTVVEFSQRKNSACLVVHGPNRSRPSSLVSRTVELQKNKKLVIRDTIEITLIEVRGDNIRLGFVVPRDVPIHRLEVMDSQKESDSTELELRLPDSNDENNDDGGAVAPVPRPKSPKPPTLDVRIEEPKNGDD